MGAGLGKETDATKEGTKGNIGEQELRLWAQDYMRHTAIFMYLPKRKH